MSRFAFLGLLIFVARLPAAEPTPRERVLRLVPPESSVVFVVQNLRDQAKAVTASPFAAWAGERFAKALGEKDEFRKLKSVEAIVTTMLGVSLTEVRDDILGDAVAFAYEPGPSGKPDEERGVVILHARDGTKLGKLIGKFNDLQIASKELDGIEQLQHRGRTYVKRIHAKRPAEFYFQEDGLFAFAAHEDAIKSLIDRYVEPRASAALQDLDALKLQDAFLACWLNPRKLDADLAAAATASPAEKAGLAQMAKLWAAVDRCAFYLAAAKDVEFGVSMTYRPDAIPTELRIAFAKAPTASPLWNIVPKDAIFAAAVNVEAKAMIEVVASFLPMEEQKKLKAQIEKEVGALVGAGKVSAVLAGLGNEFGVWAAPSAKGSGPLPTVTAAVRVRSEPDPTVPAAVMKAVDFFARSLQYDYNRRHADQIEMAERKLGDAEARVFSNEKLFPPAVEPSYAMKDGFLVAGSRPDALSSFRAPSQSLPPAAEAPLARISGVELRKQIETHRNGLAKVIAGLQDRDEDEVRRELDTFAAVLEAFDSVELLIRGDERSRTLALRARLIKPLK